MLNRPVKPSMSRSEVNRLRTAIQQRWSGQPSPKAKQYIDLFFNMSRTGQKITAQVEGNHGVYTVSIQLDKQRLSSACSCYIGKEGYCHHCEAAILILVGESNHKAGL